MWIVGEIDMIVYTVVAVGVKHESYQLLLNFATNLVMALIITWFYHFPRKNAND
jgi:hypothetical protein